MKLELSDDVETMRIVRKAMADYAEALKALAESEKADRIALGGIE